MECSQVEHCKYLQEPYLEPKAHNKPPNKALHPTAYSSVRSSLRFRRRVSLALCCRARLDENWQKKYARIQAYFCRSWFSVLALSAPRSRLRVLMWRGLLRLPVRFVALARLGCGSHRGNSNAPTATQQGAAPDRLQLRSSFLLSSLPAAGELVVRRLARYLALCGSFELAFALTAKVRGFRSAAFLCFGFAFVFCFVAASPCRASFSCVATFGASRVSLFVSARAFSRFVRLLFPASTCKFGFATFGSAKRPFSPYKYLQRATLVFGLIFGPRRLAFRFRGLASEVCRASHQQAAEQGAAPDRLQLRSLRSFLTSLSTLPAAGELDVVAQRAAWLNRFCGFAVDALAFLANLARRRFGGAAFLFSCGVWAFAWQAWFLARGFWASAAQAFLPCCKYLRAQLFQRKRFNCATTNHCT